MNNLNSILLEGNLTRDPELRHTPAGTPVCTLRVGSLRTYKCAGKRREEVTFVETETCGRLATVCAEHLRKGSGVRVIGRLKQGTRQEDGAPVLMIAAEHVEFQPRRAHRPTGEIEAIAS